MEVKAVDKIVGAHKAQVRNYLVASGLRAGLVINFGNPKVEVARLTNPNIIADCQEVTSNLSYPSYPS